MKLQFKNHLTLRTVPSSMSKAEILCSSLTWLLTLGFIGIILLFFFGANLATTFAYSIYAWLVVLAAAVGCSLFIDYKQRIINPGSILWLIFLTFLTIDIVGN